MPPAAGTTPVSGAVAAQRDGAGAGYQRHADGVVERAQNQIGIVGETYNACQRMQSRKPCFMICRIIQARQPDPGSIERKRAARTLRRLSRSLEDAGLRLLQADGVLICASCLTYSEGLAKGIDNDSLGLTPTPIDAQSESSFQSSRYRGIRFSHFRE